MPARIKNRYTVKHFSTQQEFVDPKVYSKVIKDLMALARHKMIYEGEDIEFPQAIGTIIIRRWYTNVSKEAKKIVDFGLSRKVGKTMYFNNQHSHRWIVGFRWNKLRQRLKYIRYYRFVPVRGFKRELAKAIKHDNTIFQYIRL